MKPPPSMVVAGQGFFVPMALAVVVDEKFFVDMIMSLWLSSRITSRATLRASWVVFVVVVFVVIDFVVVVFVVVSFVAVVACCRREGRGESIR